MNRTYKGYTITTSGHGYFVEGVWINDRPFWTKKLRWAKTYIDTLIERKEIQARNFETAMEVVDPNAVVVSPEFCWYCGDIEDCTCKH